MVFFGRTDAKTETPRLWLPCARSWLTGKDSDAGRDWGQEEKGTTEDEMAGWHHQLDWHEFGWNMRVDDGQGGLAYCDAWGHRELDTTELLNWTELNDYYCLASFHVLSWHPFIILVKVSFPGLCSLLSRLFSFIEFWEFLTYAGYKQIFPNICDFQILSPHWWHVFLYSWCHWRANFKDVDVVQFTIFFYELWFWHQI